MKKITKKKQKKLDEINRIKSLNRAIKTRINKKVLAIDPASHLGWAFSICDYGNIIFKISKKEHNGHKWGKIEDWLENFATDFDIIITEMPISRHSGATIHHSKIVGLIEKFCAKHHIEYMVFDPKTYKKFATGNGNANKLLMVDIAKEKLGYIGDDDNEADALWMYIYAKFQLTK